MDNWALVWTVVWFASIAVFSLLAVLVIILGASDLVALLKGLRERSDAPSDPAESPK